jgi:hypothetical protein
MCFEELHLRRYALPLIDPAFARAATAADATAGTEAGAAAAAGHAGGALDAQSLARVLDSPALRTSVVELSIALFGHKWADLTMSDLEQQVRGW